MAKPYTINITNGQGNANILNGEYTISSNTNGYDNTSIDPKSLTVVEGQDTYNLKIAASGTLTLHVSETGLEDGTPIVGATFIRCDSVGTQYGNVFTTDQSGNAIISNVPFSASNAPIIYIKQTASDSEHEFSSTIKEITLTESTKTEEIQNSLPVSRTINFTDLNYEGLLITSGEITLS